MDTESSACPRGNWPLDLSPEVEVDSPRRVPEGEASLFTPRSWTRSPTVCLPSMFEDFEDLEPAFEPDRGRTPRTPTCSEADSTQSDWRSGAWEAPPELPSELLDLFLAEELN